MSTVCVQETDLMVPKRKSAKPGKPESAPVRPTVFSMKGTPEWRDWVQSLAAHARTDAAKLIDALLAEYAKKNGLPAPPRR